MGRIYDSLDNGLVDWIKRQHLFFVATAPASGGHVNCSPKGLEMLRVIDPLTVAYLDFTGSGVETIAHLRENGRIVLMFCAFEGPPKILRVHGHGTVIQAGEPRFEELLQHFLPLDAVARTAARSIILIAVERIADSCGYGVPLMQYEGDRTQLTAWAANRIKHHGPSALLQYQAEKNLESVDGLPGLDPSVPPLQAVVEVSDPAEP
jgi:hypothetical protein